MSALAPSDRRMRLAAVTATVMCLVLLATACVGGHQSEVVPAPKIRLAAQQAPQTGGGHYHWTTTRKVVVTCGANASIRGSNAATARRVCGAVAYYARHRPAPCVPHSDIAPFVRRVGITATTDGHPDPALHAEMGFVCNPPAPLGRAVQTIYIAAFR
jgi:hypothetical protein